MRYTARTFLADSIVTSRLALLGHVHQGQHHAVELPTDEWGDPPQRASAVSVTMVVSG